MGILSWITKFISDNSSGIRNEIGSPLSVERLLDIVGVNTASASGVAVTPETAMKQATVYSCVRLLSETISQLPLHLYKRNKDGRERATEHQLYDLLRISPNGFMTASEFWQFMAAAVILRGMACSFKNKIGNRLIELIPISPNSIEEVWTGNKRMFNVLFADGKYATVDPSEIFCVKGMSLDGRSAVSPIKYAANSIGLSISAQNYNSCFYRNGARPSGVLKTSAALDEKKIDLLRNAWKSQYGGEKSGDIAVLTAGLDFQAITMSNEDAQLLESLGYQRTEICGIFGVPPHMIGAIEKTSSWGTGLAEQSLSFIKYTVSPWLQRIEQSVIRDLLSSQDKKQFYPEFLTEQFLRGDTKNRYEAYKIALGGTQSPGFMTINEVRRLENLEPISDGDTIHKPVPGAKNTERTPEDEKQTEA